MHIFDKFQVRLTLSFVLLEISSKISRYHGMPSADPIGPHVHLPIGLAPRKVDRCSRIWHRGQCALVANWPRLV